MSEINEPPVPRMPKQEGGQNNEHHKPGRKRGRKKIIFIGSLLALFIVIGAIGAGFAKNKADKFRKHGMHGFIIERIVKDLDLNEQQRKEVDKIKDEIKAKMDEKKKNRGDNMSEFEQMFRADTFDKQKALELAGRRDADREEMRSFMVEQVAKVHAILTPDQRNKAADKMKEMRERRHNRNNKREAPGK